MKLTHSTATSGTQKSPLHRLRNIIGNATTAAALALGGQAAMADTVDTRPLMTSTVVQDGSAFSYGVTIGGRAVPAGNPVQLFPNRYNKADTVTSVDLSNFFSLTATNSTENTKLEGGKKTLITELIQEAAQNFPSTQNGAKIIHLHCSKTCADALKKMNLTFEGATQIVWDIASTVGSQNTLTIGPKDLSTEYKQDLARGISQVSVSPVARYTNDHPGIVLGGVASLGILTLTTGVALGRRGRRIDPAVPAVPEADAPAVPVRVDINLDTASGTGPTAEGVSDAGGVSMKTSTELNKDYLLGSILEPLGIFHDNITVVEKDGLTELDVRIGDDDLSIGVTSRVLTYYLYKNSLPLKTDGTWGEKEEDADDIGASVLATTLQSIIRGKETAPVDILTETGVNIENIADTTGEMRDTIESIRATLESGGYAGILDFSIPTYSGEKKGDLRVTTFVSYEKGKITLYVNSAGHVSIGVGELAPFDTVRDTLRSFGRPTSTDSTSAA